MLIKLAPCFFKKSTLNTIIYFAGKITVLPGISVNNSTTFHIWNTTTLYIPTRRQLLLRNRPLVLLKYPVQDPSRGSWSLSTSDHSMSTVQCSWGEDVPTLSHADWEGITTQGGFTFHSFNWTWARKHGFLTTTSNHTATQKETLQSWWYLWWQRRQTEVSGSWVT